MSEEYVLSFCEYDQATKIPNLHNFRSVATCDWLLNEIYVLGENVHKRTELWRYDISKNTWFQMNSSHFNFYQFSSLPKPMMAIHSSGSLMIIGCNLSENFQAFLYEVNSMTCDKLQTVGKPLHVCGKVFDPMCMHGKSVVVFASDFPTSVHAMFYELGMQDLTWKFFCNPFESFDLKPFQYTLHENKLYVFASHLISEILTCAQTVYRFDLSLRKWSSIVTTPIDPAQRPNGVKCYSLLKIENFLFFVGGFRAQGGRFNRKIWRFNIDSFVWSLVPFLLPEGELKFLSDLNTEGEMYVGYEKGIYKINLLNDKFFPIDLLLE